MDGHSNHITANVIAFCMQHAIDVLILPPHKSHLLQPLDVGVFTPVKRALAIETLWFDAGRMPRVQWVKTYILARERALEVCPTVCTDPLCAHISNCILDVFSTRFLNHTNHNH
jgi:hypothetical protein